VTLSGDARLNVKFQCDGFRCPHLVNSRQKRRSILVTCGLGIMSTFTKWALRAFTVMLAIKFVFAIRKRRVLIGSVVRPKSAPQSAAIRR
jgi:hypothetical protein